MVATMPTGLDLLKTHLLGAEVGAQLEQALAMRMARMAGNPTHLERVKANVASPNVAQVNQSLGGFEGLLTVILGIGVAVGKAMQYVQEPPASPGYEPLLIESGWNPLAARGMAKLAVRRGERCAKESKRHRPV